MAALALLAARDLELDLTLRLTRCPSVRQVHAMREASYDKSAKDDARNARLQGPTRGVK